MTDVVTIAARPALRQLLRARRAALRPGQRQRSAARVAAALAATSWLRRGNAVGLYASLPDELDTTPIRCLAAQRCCSVYLPRIVDYRDRRLAFCRDRGGPLRRNRYAIGEPLGSTIDVRWLKVLLLPVLGFDRYGARLGFGGGYYDRALAWRLDSTAARGPLLIGLAYDCQEVSSMLTSPQDVTLDGIVTESGVKFFQRGLDQ